MQGSDRVFGAAAALVLATGINALAGQGVTFRDKSGNMSVRNADSWLVEQLDDKFRFLCTGKPLIAAWQRQGLEVRSARLSGEAASRESGETALLTADLDGGVEAALVRDSSEPGADSKQRIRITGPKASYLASEERWTLPSGFDMTRSDPGAGQSNELRAGRGVVHMHPSSGRAEKRWPFRQADLTSDVRFKFVSRRRVAVANKPGQFESRQYTVQGRADRLTYEDSSGTLTLTGNVQLDGDDPTVMGELEAASAVLTLDDRARVKRIELKGEPGRSRLHIPPEDASQRGRSR